MTRRVRPLTAEEHIHVIDYFLSGSDEFLHTMGVQRDRLKSRDEWHRILLEDFARPLHERSRSYVGWEFDGRLIGHSSISEIQFGKEAYVHLHIWVPPRRKSGLGGWFFCHSLAYFFETFEFERLNCEPRAENPAPNGLLVKLGLEVARSYVKTPGPHCFEQTVNRYEIQKSQIPALLQRVGT